MRENKKIYDIWNFKSVSNPLTISSSYPPLCLNTATVYMRLSCQPQSYGGPEMFIVYHNNDCHQLDLIQYITILNTN